MLIVVDSLRADSLPVYGARDVAAPTIEQLAANGVLFKQAIAQGHATWTTMPTLLSGCYPSTYGGFETLDEARPRLAAELKALGYRTAAFAPNPYLTRARGYEPGFDHFDECQPNSQRAAVGLREWAVRGINRLGRRWGLGIECPPYLPARAVTDRAMQWIKQSDEPFFLWIQYMDVHIPYNLQRCALLWPKGRWPGQRPYAHGFWKRCVQQPEQITDEELLALRRLYREGITSVDAQVGRLRQALEERGDLAQTTFVLTADHGEEFREHGLFGHQAHLYEQSIHVPLVITAADGQGRPSVSAQVRHLDLAPTLIELAGGVPPAAMQGQSLVPALTGAGAIDSRPAISQTHPKNNWAISWREPPWKLIWHTEPDTLHSRAVELYHLDRDPAEQDNLSAQHPDRVGEMQAKLRKHITQLDLAAYGSPAAGKIDPQVRERLKALGYWDS